MKEYLAGARRILVASALLSTAAALAVPPIIDGRNIPSEFGTAIATQRFQTQFADHTEAIQFGEGSELDQLFVTHDANRLYIGVTGNLKNDGNGLMIFIDTDGPSSGTNVIDVQDDFLDVVAGLRDNAAPGPNIYGTPRYLAGAPGIGWHTVTLESGFAADYVLGFSGGSPLGSQIRTYYLVNWTTLDPAGAEGHTNQVAGMITAGDATASGPAGTLGSFLQTANLNILGAGDNAGTAGVEGGNGLATQDPASQTTGFEFGIPLSLLGLEAGDQVCLFVALTGTDGFISNQFLPTDSTSTELSNLGVTRPVSFATMPGQQFACYTLTTACACLADLDSGNDIGLGDLALLLASFGSANPNPCYDLDGSSPGVVSLGDLAVLLSRFGTICN